MVSIAFNSASQLASKQADETVRALRTGYRFTRLVSHCSAAALMLPRHYLRQQTRQGQVDHLLEEPAFKRWLDNLVRVLNVEICLEGESLIDNGFFVANHISWLDAVVLAQIANFSFIAKNEVKRWPLIGHFSQMMRTVFIQRKNKFSVYRSLPQLEHQLHRGQSLLVFPEGTTTTGRATLPFFPMLYQSAVTTGRPVQPIAIRYSDLNNNFLADIGFVEDDTLFDTLFRMLREDQIRAHIHVLPPIAAGSMNRKEMAKHSRDAIAERLAGLTAGC